MIGKGAVLVTGTSSGIGRATALELDRIGFTVFATVRKETDAQQFRQSASSQVSSRLIPVLMDVTDENSVALAFRKISESVGEAGLAGLVNNAGIGTFGPIEALPLDALRHQLHTNVVGQVAVIQAFLPLLRKARGRIVNIGSVGGRTTIPFGGALCASKYAVEAINDALRMELRPWGIAVSLVVPGSIHTAAVDRLVDDGERLIARAAEDRMNLYVESFRRMLKKATHEESAGSSPVVVARIIARALTDPKPRIRYPAGSRSMLLAILPRILPTRLFDWIKLKRLGLCSI